MYIRGLTPDKKLSACVNVIIFLSSFYYVLIVYRCNLTVYQTQLVLTMVVTQQQLTSFFTAADQMGILAATYMQMQNDGITTFEDLLTFKLEDVKCIAEGLHCPSG